jgi:hypothetical protein
MKPVAILLLVAVCSWSPAWGDEPKPAEKQPAAKADEKQPEANAEAPPKLDAGQLLQVFKAFGVAIDDIAAVAVQAVEVQVAGDPLEQQFRGQFQQLLKTELRFVQTVCRPNAEQYKKIKAAGDVALQATVKKFAEVQKQLQQGGFRAGQQPQFPDPRQMISSALLLSVKQNLSADQLKTYEQELASRAAARKRAAMLNLIAKLDRDLVLTAEQRGKFTKLLNDNWQESWEQQLEVFMYGDQFFPVLPDDKVTPLLSANQKSIWSRLPKHQNTIWGWAGMGFLQPVDLEGDAVVEEAVAEPAKAQRQSDMPEEPNP